MTAEKPRIATLWLPDIHDWALAGYDDRRGIWFLIEGRGAGDLGPDRVQDLTEAGWDTPPPGLPATLSSVGDVGQVLTAAGLPADEHIGEWIADGIRVVLSPRPGVMITVYAHVQLYGRRPVADIYYGGETAAAWSAIAAARTASTRPA